MKGQPILWWFGRGASGECHEHQVLMALMSRAGHAKRGLSVGQCGETVVYISLH
jgi:hypothetical protein